MCDSNVDPECDGLPTNSLRFVLRGGEKVLQQGYRIIDYSANSITFEWHDVQVEVEVDRNV